MVTDGRWHRATFAMMIHRTLLFSTAICIAWRSVLAQTAVPYVNANDHFGVFQNGVFHELTSKPPVAVFPNADRLGFITQEGALELWNNGAVLLLAQGCTNGLDADEVRRGRGKRTVRLAAGNCLVCGHGERPDVVDGERRAVRGGGQPCRLPRTGG